MTKLFAAAIAGALGFTATPSLALKFDFTSPTSDLGIGNTFSKGGVSGIVTASAVAGKSSVVNLGAGLGIKTSCLFCGDDDPAIDGVVKEKLTFTFDDHVELVSIDIAAVDGEDDWDILVDDELIVRGSTTDPFIFPTPKKAMSFSVLADDAFECTKRGFLGICKRGGPDDVTVAGFTVVPLPGALPLIATGAVFFGWAARRKRAA